MPLWVRLEKKTNLPVKKNKVDFDLHRDWGLVESSFIQDYGIRLTKEYLSSISFSEFSNLLNGLTKNTALGQQMLLRATKNNKAFNNMSGKNKTELTVDWKDKKQKNMFFDLMRPRKR